MKMIKGPIRYVVIWDGGFPTPKAVVDQGKDRNDFLVWEPSTGGLFAKGVHWDFHDSFDECLADCRKKYLEEYDEYLKHNLPNENKA